MVKKNDKIQIPINEGKKQLLGQLSLESGFDSSTDLLKFMINSFINGSISIGINKNQEKLDKATELELLESVMDYKKGNFTEIDFKKKNWIDSVLEDA